MKKSPITVLICLLSITTSFSNPKENVINSIKVSTKDTIKINASDLISKEIAKKIKAIHKSNYFIGPSVCYYQQSCQERRGQWTM